MPSFGRIFQVFKFLWMLTIDFKGTDPQGESEYIRSFNPWALRKGRKK